MILKELRESLKKFTSDFDEAEILIKHSNGDKSDFDLMAAVGMTKEMDGIIFITYNETKKMINSGQIDLDKFKDKNS